MPATNSTYVVAYAAKSSADPRGSIETQLADCQAMAEREGWQVIASYSDEAKSAYHGDRGDGLLQAREHAERLAADHGEAVLCVQHTDRLARGDGIAAQHLVEVVLWANRAGVRVRSVQDDRTGESVLDAAMTGTRNHEDSARKAAATKSGMRRTVERGEWRGGIVPGGYQPVRAVDDRGRVTRKLRKHPDDAETYDLIWAMAAEGASLQAISLELSRRGAQTRPVRKDYKPRSFDVNRVSQILENGFYAGIVEWGGEVVPVSGDWPTYTDPETFHRLKADRAQRANREKRTVGRPRERMLLGYLAVCGLCGSTMKADTSRRIRPDGSRRRTYVCRAHREHHAESAEYCPAGPFDAAECDRMVLDGLNDLLGSAGRLRERMLAGHRAERERLSSIVQDASADAKGAEKAAQLADEKYADALAEGDDDALPIILSAAKIQREKAARAQSRANAALDALSAAESEPEGKDADRLMRALYDALDGRIRAAGDDVKALNALLRECFARFELRQEGGRPEITPVLTDDATLRFLRDRLDGKASPVHVRAHAIKDFDFENDAAIALEVCGPDPLRTNPQSGR